MRDLKHEQASFNREIAPRDRRSRISGQGDQTVKESPTNTTPGSPEPVEPLSTDLKIFYGFVVVLILGLIGVLVYFTRPAAPAKPVAGEPATPRSLIEFALTDQTGRTITRAELEGNFVVVNFVHTSCSISCLEVNRQMAELQRLTAGQNDVRLISLTVDPRTDTPPVLAEYGAQFGADTNRWLLLTGDKAVLYELIEKSFLQRDTLANDNLMPGGFVGVQRIALVDRSGRVRRYFDGMKRSTPAAVVEVLDQLRAEKGQP
jgi:cytochrome oxidase Cu insertion factor (SCO1/SenC/PrrC family)